VKALLGCSSPAAQNIVRQYSHADPDSLESAMLALTDPYYLEDVEKPKTMKPDPEYSQFHRIKPRGMTQRFFKYLQGRGYENPQEIIAEYGMRCALTGRYKDRIIVPVRLNGELLGWTSRALGSPVNAPRYLESSRDIKTGVLHYDELKKGGERLFIVEGPFDAIRLDSFGTMSKMADDDGYRANSDSRIVDYRATCTFGTSVVVSQIALLRTLVKRFKETWVMFDKGAEQQGRDLADWLGVKIAMLPPYIDDPGDLGPDQLSYMAEGHYDGDYPMGLSSLIRTKFKNAVVQNITSTNRYWVNPKPKP
jgi:hypothetical protein